MSASTYEYKTVALPQTVQGKRKRGTSEADLVAGAFGEVIHLEAVDGWEYMRSDVLAAGTRGGMFSKEPTVTYYSVLVFRRMLESAWPTQQQPQAHPQPQAQPAPPPPAAATPAPAPRVAPAPAPARAPEPAPVRPRATPAPVPRKPIPAPAPARAAPSPMGDPTSPLAQGMLLTTGGQYRAGEGSSFDTSPPPSSNTPPRPPLGSAQD